MGFIDLEKAYDRVDREALWQMLRIYDVGDKLLSRIKSIYVENLACVRVKGSAMKEYDLNEVRKEGNQRLLSLRNSRENC